MKINLNEITKQSKHELSRVPLKYVYDQLKQKGFLIFDENKIVVDIIIKYFLKDETFLKSKLVKSENSFDKGLLIFGDYGIGKTMLFETLHQIGRELILSKGNGDLYFTKISAGRFIDDYMNEVGKNNTERRLWIEDYYKGRLYIDDLGFEKLAFNKTELLAELLFERNRKKSITFVTTNLKPSEITERYGMRIGDRLPEMFNIINWKGESHRK